MKTRAQIFRTCVNAKRVWWSTYNFGAQKAEIVDPQSELAGTLALSVSSIQSPCLNEYIGE